MEAFAALLDDLVYTRSRDAQDRLYCGLSARHARPGSRLGAGRAGGTLSIATVKNTARSATWPTSVSTLHAVSHEPRLCRRHRRNSGVDVGPASARGLGRSPKLGEVIDLLNNASRARAPSVLGELMDRLDANGRYALLKLASAGLRVGISARLAKTAFAQGFDKHVDDVEEVWHALRPPYAELFAWGEGKSERPDPADSAFFRPFMLAHPLEDGMVDLADFAAEWKWDGIRIQIASTGGETRLFSRGGDEVTGGFPEIAGAFSGDRRGRWRVTGARRCPGRRGGEL